MRSETFVLGLRLEGKLCLVVGGDEDAARRARALHAAGAHVRVVSENPAPELEHLATQGALVLERRAFALRDLDGVWLAVSTDVSPALSAEIAEQAEARRIFFCAVDRPDRSSYSHLAIARSGPVAVAISTSGRAPALARRLREEFERLFESAGLGAFAEKLAVLRERTASPERRGVLGAAVHGVRFDGRLALPAPDPPRDGPGGARGD